MKRILLVLSALLLVLGLSSCAGNTPRYKDGVYTANATEYDKGGWQELVEITIKDGQIEKVVWDAHSKDPYIYVRKKQYSRSGLYGMLVAGAQNEWCDQARVVEDFVTKNGLEAIGPLLEGGYTDAISGCSVHIDVFVELAEECLRQASA